MSQMTETRFHDLAEAYGADLAKWPETERASAQRLLQETPSLAAVLEAESFLDLQLSDFMTQPVEIALPRLGEEIIEKKASMTLRGLLNTLWPFGGLWQPAAGLAAASLAGFLIGANLQDVSTATSSTMFDTQQIMVERALGIDVTEIN